MDALPLFSAVILDLDGLILDSETGYKAAWQQAACMLGYELTDEFCLSVSGQHGKSVVEQLLNHYGPDFPLDQFHCISGEIWLHHVQQYGIPVKTGFFQLYQTLNDLGLPYCVATNSDAVNADRCLQIAGVRHLFRMIITRDQVAEGKPSPDLFLLAAEKMESPIAKCLVIEDSGTGIKAAVAAGANSVLIPSLNPADPEIVEIADFVFDDLAILAENIKCRFQY